jgi:hypothetical protein
MPYGTVLADLHNDSLGNTFAPASSVFRNRIINGAMVIDQRNSGASVTALGYTLDRFGIFATQVSKFSIQQNAGSVTPPTGFVNYAGITSLSAFTPAAGDFFGYGQAIEGYNTADLNWGTVNAKTITFSFWVRSSLTGTFGGFLKNNAGDRFYIYSYTVSSANTWEQKSITIAGDTGGTWNTTNGLGIYVAWGLGAGSTYSGGSASWGSTFYNQPSGSVNLVSTNGATFYITGVQLEVGTNATNFDYRPYGTELALCQRYFWRFASDGTASGFPAIGSGNINTATTSLISIPNPVSMRTSPTFSYNGTIIVNAALASPSVSSVSAFYGGLTSNMVVFNLNSVANTGYGAIAYLSNATTNFISLSAEL